MLFSFGGLEEEGLGLGCRCVLFASSGCVVADRRPTGVYIWLVYEESCNRTRREACYSRDISVGLI